MEAMLRTFKLGPKDLERISAAPNEPHHHAFEELIIGVAGTLEHFIDYRSESIDAPFVSFVTKGKVHRVRPAAKDGRCDMTVIRLRCWLAICGTLMPRSNSTVAASSGAEA